MAIILLSMHNIIILFFLVFFFWYSKKVAVLRSFFPIWHGIQSKWIFSFSSAFFFYFSCRKRKSRQREKWLQKYNIIPKDNKIPLSRDKVVVGFVHKYHDIIMLVSYRECLLAPIHILYVCECESYNFDTKLS